MKISILMALLFTLISCVPEQEAIEFGVTIKPMSGESKEMVTKEDEPLLINYEIPVAEDAIDVNLKIVAEPLHGKLEKCEYLKATQVQCIYIPKQDFYGKDKIGFKGKDGDFFADEMSFVEIDITPVPDAPVSAKGQYKKGGENSIIKFNVLAGKDVDSSNLRYQILEPPSVGVLSNCLNNDSDLSCEYEPPTDFIGEVTFSYNVLDDGDLVSQSPSVVKIKVLDTPVVGSDQSVNVDQYSSIEFAVNPASDTDSLQEDLSYFVSVKPKNGELAKCFIKKGNVSCVYKPNYGFLGSDTMAYKVVDESNLNSIDEAVVTFVVDKVDLPPEVAAVQTITVLQNGTKNFTINMAKDEDSDPNKLNYIIVNNPKNGVLSNCLSGVGVRSCTYSPNLNINGVDSFTYKVVDDTGVTSKTNGTIKFNIQKVYQKPVVGANQKVALVQGSKKSFTVNAGKDVDTDVSQLKYTIVTSPKNGSLESCFVGNANLQCTYNPNKGTYGSDQFTYKIVDEKGLSSGNATVEFNVISRKKPRLGNPTVISLKQFDVKKFQVEKGIDEDTSEFSLFYKVATQPKNGKLTECFIQVGDLNCVYSPSANFYGEDSFEYYIEDDYGLKSANSKVEIVINPRAKPVPYALDKFVTPENTKLEFVVTQAIDADSSSTVLRYKLVDLPKSGLLKNCFVSTGHYGCEYMPNNKFTGIDEFTYKVVDEKGLESDTLGKVSIEIKKRLPPVIGANKSYNTKQNTAVKVTVTAGTDDDTPVSDLQYSIVSKPLYGKLASCFLLKGNRDCTYSPNINFYGTDSFTYKITDKYGYESLVVGKVTINVEKVAVKPKVGKDQFYKISKNTSQLIEVSLAIDPDSNLASMSYIIVTPPSSGTLTNCFVSEGNRKCTYTPNQNFYGSDKFTYKVKDDGGLVSDTVATVYLDVIDVNEKPAVGANQTFDIIQGKNLTFMVPKGFDKDSADNQLNYFVVKTPTEGSLIACFLVAGNKQCTYTPNKFFYGKDSFQYKIKDETNYVSPTAATVTFNVIRRQAPVPQSQSIAVKQYSNKNSFVVTAATDADSAPSNLSYTITKQPTHGVVSDCFLTKGFTSCKYTPTGNFYGLDSFSYKVVDEYNIQSAIDGKVSIAVEKVDLKPSVGANQSVTLDMNTIASFSVNKGKDADTPDNELTYKVVTQPKNGVLDGCFAGKGSILCKYVPTQYYYGTDSFTYKIVDNTGKESTSVATVSFVINKVNIAPVAGANQTIKVITNNVKSFTVSSGSDLDGDPLNLTYQVVTAPKNGKLSNCFPGEGKRTCTYTPNPGYYGSDSFFYNVKDLTNLISQNNAKVTFLVEKPKERPIVGPNITLAVEEGKSISFNVPLATDNDSFAGDLSYRVQVNPSYGTLTNCLSSKGVGIRTCTYTPKTGFNGKDTFQYDVVDESNLVSSTRGTVTINTVGKIYSTQESFTQGASIKMKGADIVWIIDNSGSMGNDQTTLSNSFDSFINGFLVNGKARYPFNILVTTTDKRHQTQYFGKLTSAKAEADFTTFRTDFKSAVKVGTNGSGSERAFESGAAFYSAHSGQLGGNDRLAIYIVVSDEREQSTSKNVQQWAHSFQATKDNPAKVRFFNIINSDSNDRYRDMASYTGGANYKITNNFDGILNSISSAVTSLLDSYILKGGRTILENSIVVEIDGKVLPKTEYTYGLNSIKFKKPPMAGATITVNYDYNLIYTGP